MLNFLQQYMVDFSRVQWRYFYISLIFLMVVFTFLMALIASLQPIQQQHYVNILSIAVQAKMPRSQRMAQHLLSKDQVDMAEYLKLMQAMQKEQSQLQYYPALELVKSSHNADSANVSK